MLIIEKAVKELRNNLSSMTEVVLDMLDLVKNSLEQEKINELEIVFKQDKHLDQLEKSLDRQCMELLALINPHASDLRFVFSVIKVNVDLERMGDECKNVAREMKGYSDKVPPEMKQLAEMVYATAKSTFQALETSDSKLAKNLILDDDKIDTLEYNILQKYPQIGISFTTKALERITDHATNIAESIIYYVEGIDVRHENSILQRLGK
jgi:phosphate transport system protein